MQPEWHGAVFEQRVMKPAERVLRSHVHLVVVAQLLHHQLAGRVEDVRRIERSALCLTPRAALFNIRLVAEEAHTLLHRHVFAVETDADDESTETDERLGKLAEPHARLTATETLIEHHLLAIVGPAFDKGGRRKK